MPSWTSAARGRLKEVYDTSITELGSALSPDLRDELHRVAIPFNEGEEPSDAELRIAQAQLVGWLEGLFHGIQATLFAQQMAARSQLEDMRRQLPPGAAGPGGMRPGPGRRRRRAPGRLPLTVLPGRRRASDARGGRARRRRPGCVLGLGRRRRPVIHDGPDLVDGADRDHPAGVGRPRRRGVRS